MERRGGRGKWDGEKRRGEKGGGEERGERGKEKVGGEKKKSARGDDHLNTKYTAQHSLSNVDGNIFRFNASLQIIILYNRQ